MLNDDNEQDSPQNRRECRERHAECVVEGVVDGIDVLGESVHNSTKGRGVEEAHRCAHHALHGVVVERLGSLVAQNDASEPHQKRKDRLCDTKSGVDSHLRNG